MASRLRSWSSWRAASNAAKISSEAPAASRRRAPRDRTVCASSQRTRVAGRAVVVPRTGAQAKAQDGDLGVQHAQS